MVVQAITSPLQWLTLITPPLSPVAAINQHTVRTSVSFRSVTVLKHKRQAERGKNHGRIYPTINHMEQQARSAESLAHCVASGILYIFLADIKCWRDVMRSAPVLLAQPLDHMGPRNTTMAWMAGTKLFERRLSAGSAAPGAALELFGAPGPSGGMSSHL